MPGFDVECKGFEELKAKLALMAGPAAKRIRNRALRAGSEVFKAAIEERTPERPDLPSTTALPPGAMKADIKIKAVSAPEETSSTFVTGPGKYTRHAMRLVEFGHNQVRNVSQAVGTRGKGLNRAKNGGTVVKRVEAHPIVRPAFEAALEPAVDAFIESVKQDFASGEAAKTGGE